MNTENITTCLSFDRYANVLFKRVCSRDEFIESIKPGEGFGLYVFNTHYSHQGGEHWLGAFYTRKKLEIFDSFGRNPHEIIKDVCEKAELLVEKISWNESQIQGITTNTCGDYCVVYGLLLARGWKIKEIVEKLLDRESFEVGDHGVRRFILEHFGTRAVGEVDFPSNQAQGVDRTHVQLAFPPIDSISL